MSPELLIRQAHSRHQLWRELSSWQPIDAVAALLLPIVIPLVIYVSADFWQAVGILPQWASFFLEQTPTALVLQYAFSLVVEVGVIIWLARIRQAGFADFGFKLVKIQWYVVAILLYLVQIFLIIGIFVLLNRFLPAINTDEKQPVLEFGRSGWGFWLSFISSVVVAPVIEELMFRGIIFAGLSKRYPLWLAAVGSSLAFALLHGQVNVGIYTFVFGLILSWLYFRSGSLYPGITAHFINNLIAFWLLS
jgi:membrane protease YdiL (CAAX protease family)